MCADKFQMVLCFALRFYKNRVNRNKRNRLVLKTLINPRIVSILYYLYVFK